MQKRDKYKETNNLSLLWGILCFHLNCPFVCPYVQVKPVQYRQNQPTADKASILPNHHQITSRTRLLQTKTHDISFDKLLLLYYPSTSDQGIMFSVVPSVCLPVRTSETNSADKISLLQTNQPSTKSIQSYHRQNQLTTD